MTFSVTRQVRVMQIINLLELFFTIYYHFLYKFSLSQRFVSDSCCQWNKLIYALLQKVRGLVRRFHGYLFDLVS